MKAIIIICILFLSKITFAQHVGEQGGQSIAPKLISEGILNDFLISRYGAFEDIVNTYNKNAKKFNLKNNPDYTLFPSFSAGLLKYLKIKKIPILKRYKNGHVYKTKDDELFMSVELFLDNAVRLNGKKILLLGKNKTEVLKNTLKSINSQKNKKTSFIDFFIPKSYAGTWGVTFRSVFYGLGLEGRKEVALLYAVINVWNDYRTIYKDGFKKTNSCQFKEGEAQIDYCNMAQLNIFAKKRLNSCHKQESRIISLNSQLSSESIMNYRKNPDKNSSRKYITELEYLYMKEYVNKNQNDIRALAYYETANFNKSNNQKATTVQYLNLEDNIKKTRKIMKKFFPKFSASKRGTDTKCDNLSEGFSRSFVPDIDRKRNLAMTAKATQTCEHIKGLNRCLRAIYKNEKQVVGYFNKGREENKDIERDEKRPIMYDFYNDRDPLYKKRSTQK